MQRNYVTSSSLLLIYHIDYLVFQNDLVCLVRAHEVQEDGFKRHFDPSLMEKRMKEILGHKQRAKEVEKEEKKRLLFGIGELLTAATTAEGELTGTLDTSDMTSSPKSDPKSDALMINDVTPECDGPGSDSSQFATYTEDFPPVITIFSAPNYCDRYQNKAAILRIDLALDEFKVIQYSCVEHPVPEVAESQMDNHFLAIINTCPYMPTSLSNFVRLAVELGPESTWGMGSRSNSVDRHSNENKNFVKNENERDNDESEHEHENGHNENSQTNDVNHNLTMSGEDESQNNSTSEKDYSNPNNDTNDSTNNCNINDDKNTSNVTSNEDIEGGDIVDMNVTMDCDKGEKQDSVRDVTTPVRVDTGQHTPTNTPVNNNNTRNNSLNNNTPTNTNNNISSSSSGKNNNNHQNITMAQKRSSMRHDSLSTNAVLLLLGVESINDIDARTDGHNTDDGNSPNGRDQLLSPKKISNIPIPKTRKFSVSISLVRPCGDVIADNSPVTNRMMSGSPIFRSPTDPGVTTRVSDKHLSFIALLNRFAPRQILILILLIIHHPTFSTHSFLSTTFPRFSPLRSLSLILSPPFSHILSLIPSLTSSHSIPPLFPPIRPLYTYYFFLSFLLFIFLHQFL